MTSKLIYRVDTGDDPRGFVTADYDFWPDAVAEFNELVDGGYPDVLLRTYRIFLDESGAHVPEFDEEVEVLHRGNVTGLEEQAP